MSTSAYDKFKGCIFGAALGDAIGLATEFLTKERARELYGIGPIKFGKDNGYEFYPDRHRSRWETGDWTDDTDQQILIIKTLLSNNGVFNTRDFADRLSTWAEEGFPELDNKAPFGIGLTVGSVLNHPSFKVKPHRAAWEVWEQFDRNMAANGALMRTAVLGVPNFRDEKQVVKQTLQATKVTHTDPRCCVSSVIVTVLISRLLRGDLTSTNSELDNGTKQEILKWIQSGKPDNRPEDDIDSEGLFPEGSESTSSQNIFIKAIGGISKKKFPKKSDNPPPWFNRMLEKQQQSKPETTRRIPEIPIDPPPSMDTFGPDPELLSLMRDVINRYAFIADVKFPTTGQEDPSRVFKNFEQNTGQDALLKHCFPDSIAALQLDERSAMGYVYKCLGSALYCFSRDLREQPNEGEAFKRIITELVLEAGDADTNGAVAGALLGARIGYSKLPKEWLDGLRFTKWIEDMIDKLWEKFEV